MRRLPAKLPILLLAAALIQAGLSPTLAGNAIEVEARRLLLDPEQPGRTRVGALTWRGGLELSSGDSRFGGFSALLLGPEGRRITALSDRGRWLAAKLLYDETGRPTGLEGAVMKRYRDLKGKPLKKKQLRDAESVARLPNGSLLVGFERRHRIWRYPAKAGKSPLRQAAEPFPAPPDLKQAPVNSGLEAMVVLSDGRLLAFTEGLAAARDPEGLAAFLWNGKIWSRLSYRARRGFKPTAAALLPDGGVLVLERRFTLLGGLSVRLVKLAAAQIRPGAILSGQVLAKLGPPLPIDNMEALAVRRGPKGETLIYLMSDDNFNPLQRTLLLLFALEPEEP